jgi:D-alanyl-D-alanine carboxypeptidase
MIYKNKAHNTSTKYNVVRLFVALILLCTISLQGRVYAQMSSDYKAILDDALKQRTDLLNLKGTAAAVVFPDGSIWSAAEGNYGTQTLNTDLLYEVGSNTKTMISACILQLEEEEKLTLHDTLYSILDPIDDVSNGITIQQLLNHKSGLYDYTQHPDFFSFVNSNWDATITIENIFDDYMGKALENPGDKWEYCNTNYILLGMILEKIEQKPLEKILKDRLFSPLAMNNSHLAFLDSYSKTHTGSWLGSGRYLAEPSKSFMTGAWAAGAVISTPEDLALWAHKLYGGEVLQDSSFQKMTTTTKISNSESYGLGMFKTVYKGKTYLGHGGTTLQNSEMQYSIEGKFSVVTMVIENNKGSQAKLVQRKLIDILESELKLVSTPELTSELKNVVLYPNPSTDQVFIKHQFTNAVQMTIRDALGTTVMTQDLLQSTIPVRHDLSSGLYFLTVLDRKNGEQITERFIVK